MRINKIINFKRYFSRVYLWVTSAIILLVTIFSIIVYINTENIVLKNDSETSKKILFQINYNIEFVDDMIENICKYLYFDSDVQSIMYNNESNPEVEEIIRKMDRLRYSVLSTNPFLHSFSIYNNNNKTYYSTYRRLFFNDEELKKTIESYENIPKLVPIYRKIEDVNGKGDYDDVFTYFMFDENIGNSLQDGTIIVNVKFKWLLDNINSINMIGSDSSQDQVFLVDRNGMFFSNGSSIDSEFEHSLKTFYSENKQEYFSKESDFFKTEMNGQEFLVTYLYVENTDLMLLKAQPSEKVYEYINRLKYTIILITVIFILLTLLLSISVTKGIYKPVGNLVKQVRLEGTQKNENSDLKDEISFLNNVYRSNSNRLSNYESERNSYKEILKAYLLKKLLTDSASITEDDFIKARQEYRMSLSQEPGFAVCILSIDNYKECEKKYDKDLIKFAIINISSEIISSCYINEGVDIKDKHVTIIINVDEEDDTFYAKMEGLMKQAQEYIERYFEISVSASISTKTKSFKDLTAKYDNALSNSAYRFVFGRKTIITPDMVDPNLKNKRLDYSFSLEKKLVDVIKSGNIQNIEDSLNKILNSVKDLNYNNIFISLLHLIDTIRNTVDDINKTRIEPTYINFETISQNLIGMETMDEFQEKILELLQDYFQKGSNVITDSKHAVLVETVQEVIGKNYHDNDLNVSSIAEMMKISAQHLGRIFKDRTKMSIPEFINEVRMEKATKLLEQTDLTVNEISMRVGIANETYFYSVFKKKFGSTPKEYTLMKALKNVDNKKAE